MGLIFRRVMWQTAKTPKYCTKKHPFQGRTPPEQRVHCGGGQTRAVDFLNREWENFGSAASMNPLIACCSLKRAARLAIAELKLQQTYISGPNCASGRKIAQGGCARNSMGRRTTLITS